MKPLFLNSPLVLEITASQFGRVRGETGSADEDAVPRRAASGQAEDALAELRVTCESEPGKLCKSDSASSRILRLHRFQGC